jgi:hypothetical protein
VIPPRHAVLFAVVIAAAVGSFSLPPIAQDPAYHAFADQRTMFGIPNALNVLSNIPFLIAGWLGLSALWRGSSTRATAGERGAPASPKLAKMHPSEGGPYGALFGGVALTAFGSAYYHLAPDNGRLVWDRLPMTLGFMGLLTAMIGERVDRRAARLLLVPFLVLGAFSVFLWIWTERQGAGDLRLYGFVQFGSLAIVLLLLALYRLPQSGTAYLVAGLGCYAAAKVFEALDRSIYALGHIVSGHSLKHVVAAIGLACVAVMLRRRDALRARIRP